MRKYIDIDLGERSVSSRELHGREIAECGRYLIAKMLLEQKIADVEPLAAAAIAVKITFDKVFSYKEKNNQRKRKYNS